MILPCLPVHLYMNVESIPDVYLGVTADTLKLVPPFELDPWANRRMANQERDDG